ncbi:hypothetical protein AAF712_007742 [Marasmius tenuissimus]|uniref:F-box domain-containing protein n=1 Tax=Marasmius tenuissimus TaxID=585030 RepID=A0ABR2ZUF2_9AGAR
MNPFPAEIWIQIFSVACLDTGRTAESLSLVCKASHELVQQFKYQSLALLRPNDLVRFSMHLVRTDLSLRPLKHLFIALESLRIDGHGSRELLASPKNYTDQDELCTYLESLNPFSKPDEDFELSTGSPPSIHRSCNVLEDPLYSELEYERICLQERHIQKALFLTLNLSSPTLVTLSIHLTFLTRRHLLPSYTFPHLEDLTIYGPCSPTATELEGLDGPRWSQGLVTVYPSYPALKRLHLSQTYILSVSLARELLVHAPRLTHLYIHLRSFSFDRLVTSLGLNRPQISQANSNGATAGAGNQLSEITEGKFPRGLRTFYFEVDSGELRREELAGTNRFLSRAEEISMLSGANVMVCSRPAGKWADIGSGLVDWEERICGLEGRWGKGVCSMSGDVAS